MDWVLVVAMLVVLELCFAPLRRPQSVPCSQTLHFVSFPEEDKYWLPHSPSSVRIAEGDKECSDLADDSKEDTRERNAAEEEYSILAAAPPYYFVAEGRSAESFLAQASHPKQEEAQEEVVDSVREGICSAGILLAEEQH